MSLFNYFFQVKTSDVEIIEKVNEIADPNKRKCGGCGEIAEKAQRGAIRKYSTTIECTKCNIWYHKEKGRNCTNEILYISKKKISLWKCEGCLKLKETNISIIDDVAKETNITFTDDVAKESDLSSEAECKIINKLNEELEIVCKGCNKIFVKKDVGLRKNYAKAKKEMWKCVTCSQKAIDTTKETNLHVSRITSEINVKSVNENASIDQLNSLLSDVKSQFEAFKIFVEIKLSDQELANSLLKIENTNLKQRIDILESAVGNNLESLNEKSFSISLKY